MSSLCDIAHDGWLYEYYMTSGNSFSSQLGSSFRATGTVHKRLALRPVHHVQNHTCTLLYSRPGGPPCWASLLLTYCMIGYFNYCLFFLFKVRNFPFKNMQICLQVDFHISGSFVFLILNVFHMEKNKRHRGANRAFFSIKVYSCEPE